MHWEPTPEMSVSRGLLALVGSLVGCASSPKQTVPVGFVLDGDRTAVTDEPVVKGLAVRAVHVPDPLPESTDETAGEVALARSAYVAGDFDKCRTKLAAIEVSSLLAKGLRASAARVLVLDTACAWGSLDRAAAAVLAGRIAVLGLELPDLAISPDVERVIGDAVTRTGKAQRSKLAIDGVAGARVSIDGRESSCTMPCVVDLPPGDHVIYSEADGYQPVTRTVRVGDVDKLSVEMQPATPELAGHQWLARIARGLPAADATGAALIGRFSREPRVAFVHADTQLAGTLIIDGKPVASAVRRRDEVSTLLRDLAYDGGVLRRPSIWERPTFWIAATIGTALVGGALIWIFYEPDPRTRLQP